MIFAALMLAAINDVKERADINGGRLNLNPNVRNRDGGSGVPFNAEGSRRAAGFLTFICCAGIVYHSVSILIRVYCICTGTRRYMCLYLLSVSKSVCYSNNVHV